MKINPDDFCLREGNEVNLKKWSALIDPVYKSKAQYEKLLEEHVEQLSAMQQLHYSTNRHALLLIFQAMSTPARILPLELQHQGLYSGW